MSKVLQERGPGSLPSSTEINLRDHVKSISTTNEADIPLIRLESVKWTKEAVNQFGGVCYKLKEIDEEKDKKQRGNQGNNASLADLGASVSVMPYSTFTNLGLGKLAPTKLIIELADKTIKHAKGLRKRMELNLETRQMGESLTLNRSQDNEFGDFLELNDLNEPLELRNHKNEDLGPTIEEGEIVDEPMVDVVKISVEPRRKGGKEVKLDDQFRKSLRFQFKD
ncbi:hypothetical protein Tco_0974005 [Tanacetum coccineum]|uniref:Uncharacterized protein n=1 Tax=Tanacetum coccineum TaxID=301880 RepID=A0ABQ5EAF7_9ASTR